MHGWKFLIPSSWQTIFRSGLVLGLLAGGALAQDASPSPTPGLMHRGIWEADMPAGTYFVKLADITSLSMHQYVLDGPVEVTEVNIGTIGSDLARFYYIEPRQVSTPDGIGQGTLQTLTDQGQTAAQSSGADTDDVWQKVVKNYPTTTHAHTVEYRLTSRDSLDQLFASIQKAWFQGSTEAFKP